MAEAATQLDVLFARMRAGNGDACEAVVSLLYGELRVVAGRHMRRERRSHTLQPTALLNEACLRLMGGLGELPIQDRAHFFALAAQAMRRVLVEHARRRNAGKRGGELVRVTISSLAGPSTEDLDVLGLDRALTELAVLDARAAQVVELRFFGGHTDSEVSELLGQSVASTRRDWIFARSWLRARLKTDESHEA